METPLQIRRAVEIEIRTAFRGVTLGQGISLRQARFADRFQDVPPHLRMGEIADDWSLIQMDELESESDGIAHLDAFGFRYYIPALMLSVINHYESSSMRVIGTLGGLYPKKDNSWEYHMHRYSLLNPPRKAAIARFLAALPELVELDFQDQKIAPRSLRNYWGGYLQTDSTE
jgi:uncharacterized protein DUF6714